ncbi:MAG TPA: alcohol dehydrogenase catalytic domain-containing protein [Acidobacteriaceae bacterium]|nr:alcohol dehydrogenase catalytic domain-containing protein [Acidobacteriaceae bacterium]
MKAVQFVEVGKPLAVAEVATPTAYPGSLVFKVKACGICGSDLHAVDVPGLLQAGNVLGHEYAGEVVEIGPGVEGWSVGDRLTAVPARPCGECPECRSGRYAECSQIIAQGFDARMPGAYAEYSTCMAGLAVKIPDALNDQQAALIEPLAVGFNACRAAKLEAGASVLIVGAGAIGLAVAKWAKFFGAGEVGISEMVPARIARAQGADADLVIDASEHADPVREFERRTGRKPMVIFECVGRPMIAQLIAVAPVGAHLVLVGTGMQPEKFTVLSAAMKRLHMTFPFAYIPSDFHFVQRMLTTGRVTVDGLITDTVSLDNAPEMFARLRKPNDCGKVLIVP